MEHKHESNEAIELHISCRDLQNLEIENGQREYRARVFLLSNANFLFVGETEKAKNNPNPDFKESILVDYVFEAKQILVIEVFDINKDGSREVLGSFQTTVSEIVGARKQTITRDLHSKSGKSKAQLVVRADRPVDARTEVTWQWSGVKLMNTDGLFGKSDPFLRFFKEISGEWVQVYETEFIKNNLDPVWKPFKINAAKLCGGDYKQPFRVECWDDQTDRRHRYIGLFDITLEKLQNGENTFKLFNDKKKKETGTLKLLSFNIQKIQAKTSAILNYVKEGGQLNTIVGIDFTYSNGNLQSDKSLHAQLSDQNLNEYQQVMTRISEILLNYDHDHQVSMYGFGATLKYDTLHKGLSHCFPCNGTPEKPQVKEISGIMDVYKYALENIELNNPTYFALVLTEAVKIAKAHKESGADIYTVLLILCDGGINDMEETKKILQNAGDLPISVIMVGVGTNDFFDMKVFNDNNGLTSESGEKMARDFVQFVRYGSFNGDNLGFTRNVLAKVQQQLDSYKRLTGKTPTGL